MPDHPSVPDPDQPVDAFGVVVAEPCLLAEDVLTVSHREPERWRRFAASLDHSLGKADWDHPLLVLRTHTETIDGDEVLFALLALRPDDTHPGALFGELACSPDLYAELVKEFGLRQALPREASPPLEGLPSPAELDAQGWAELLGDDAS